MLPKKIALLLATFVLVLVPLCQAATPNAEIDALRAIYRTMGGSRWNQTWPISASVNGTVNPCAAPWFGITCDKNEHIVEISLKGVGLTGSLPKEITAFTELRGLIMSNNRITGSVPSFLMELTKLRVLDLEDNQLDGLIPDKIDNLENLEMVVLSKNNITGFSAKAIGRLTRLEVLALTDNRIRQALPEELGKLTRLSRIYLSNNHFTGSIPSSWKNLNLLHLVLDGNEISGRFPSWVTSKKNIQYLTLSNNALTGPLPRNIGDLTNLEMLLVGDNNMTGSIPSSISSLKKLVYFAAQNNKFSGSIPCSISKFGQTGSPTKQVLLFSNCLSGKLCDDFCTMNPKMEFIAFDNNFDCPIPKCSGKNAPELPECEEGPSRRCANIDEASGDEDDDSLDGSDSRIRLDSGRDSSDEEDSTTNASSQLTSVFWTVVILIAIVSTLM